METDHASKVSSAEGQLLVLVLDVNSEQVNNIFFTSTFDKQTGM